MCVGHGRREIRGGVAHCLCSFLPAASPTRQLSPPTSSAIVFGAQEPPCPTPRPVRKAKGGGGGAQRRRRRKQEKEEKGCDNEEEGKRKI